jgi:hypothetical protein
MMYKNWKNFYTWIIPKIWFDISEQLKDIYDLKTKGTLLMVIMKHSSYEEWSSVLQNVKKEVDILIKFIKKYKIDGIQFSNLQPTVCVRNFASRIFLDSWYRARIFIQ